DSHPTATLFASLGGILNLERKFQEAVEVYAELDKRMANWEPRERQALELSGSRIYSLYARGQVEARIRAGQTLLKAEIARVGEGHFDRAGARGTLANGYMRAGRDGDAVREFKTAIPILMAGSSHENPDEEDTTLVAARRQRLQNIVEAYLRLLSRTRGEPSGDVAAETFPLADAVRGQSVQHALAASSARMTAKDPALAELIRNEQDLSMQINALL